MFQSAWCVVAISNLGDGFQASGQFAMVIVIHGRSLLGRQAAKPTSFLRLDCLNHLPTAVTSSADCKDFAVGSGVQEFGGFECLVQLA